MVSKPAQVSGFLGVLSKDADSWADFQTYFNRLQNKQKNHTLKEGPKNLHLKKLPRYF